MSLSDRLKKKNAEARVAGKHPLIELGADRAVRAAYFQGLTLVALVDDDEIDEKERTYLQKLGGALDLTQDEIAETISDIEDLKGNDDAQESVVGEVIDAVSDSVMRQLFLAEFTCLSTVHDHDWEKVTDLRAQFAQMMECDLESAGFKLFDEVVLGLPKTVAKIPMLEKSFSQPMLDYLFTGYQDRLKKERRNAEVEEEPSGSLSDSKILELEKWLKNVVEGSGDWNQEYDYKSIRKKFEWGGVKKHLQTVILKMMLPYAQTALKDFKRDIPGMEFAHGTDYYVVDVTEYESGVRLLSYFSLFNEITTSDFLYSVVDRVEDASSYYTHDSRFEIQYQNGRANLTSYRWSWRSKKGKEEAESAIVELYERILSEFEFRATW